MRGDYVAVGVLIAMLAMMIFVIWRSGKDGQFRWSSMLRDSEDKPSAARLGIFVSLAVSSYIMVVLTNRLAADDVNGELIERVLFWYLFTWSGTLIFVKLLEKWDGKLPWSKS